MNPWYVGEGTPDIGEWWWAVEHSGHPCFYLRALVPADFAPGFLPVPRHVRPLQRPETGLPDAVLCATCGEVPLSEELEPVERKTGLRGHTADGPTFLSIYRSGRRPWPKTPTPGGTCWLCSSRTDPPTGEATLRGDRVSVCKRCESHLAARRK